MDNQIFSRKLNPITKKNGVSIIINDKKYIDFSSNDYLGLSQHPEIIKACINSVKKYGFGAGGSRLLSGDRKIFHKLEEKIAKFKQKQDALVFNSGYQANGGIISAFCPAIYKTILLDELCHASIIDGVLLSKVTFKRFKHNDVESLERLLKTTSQKALVITESVFSMDGDIAPLKEIVDLKNRYDFGLYVDEAHATGIFGNNGSGMVEKLNLTDKVDYIMGTFSKALGGFGAYLACDNYAKNFIINKCRSFIYSTALPIPVIECNSKSIDIVRKDKTRRQELLEISIYFKTLLQKNALKTPSDSQIIPIIIGEESKTIQISEILRKKGFWVLPIRYPTVPLNEARLRFSLNYGHTKENINEVVKILKNFLLCHEYK